MRARSPAAGARRRKRLDRACRAVGVVRGAGAWAWRAGVRRCRGRAGAPATQLRLFGKPRVAGHRRVAVTLARGDDVAQARAIARDAAAALTVELRDP